MTADVAIHLKISDTEITRQLRTRARVKGRSEDSPELVARRLSTYHSIMHPILDWHAERGIMIPIDSSRSSPCEWFSPGSPRWTDYDAARYTSTAVVLKSGSPFPCPVGPMKFEEQRWRCGSR